MASSSSDSIESQNLTRSLNAFLYCPTDSLPIDSLWYQINAYFGWDVNDETDSETIQHLHLLLRPYIWNYVRENRGNMVELLTGLRDLGPFKYASPIAFTLRSIHATIAKETKWRVWCSYCSLVGAFIQGDYNRAHNKQLLAWILMQAFEYPHSSTDQPILVEGAATCLKYLSNGAVRLIAATPRLHMRFADPERGPVTPSDWQDWAGCMHVFAAEPSNNPDIRHLAADAVEILWTQ
ncbi:hypothetical protein F5Y01DRAFT_318332 [Xylaria sp. FL0043]|nr:hypothetical protein F5Y01DRAFT_318332 [Xylaria sp. FL0043]